MREDSDYEELYEEDHKDFQSKSELFAKKYAACIDVDEGAFFCFSSSFLVAHTNLYAKDWRGLTDTKTSRIELPMNRCSTPERE